jgi:Domain of unknown function (DUF4192)
MPYDPGTHPVSAAMARAGSRVLGARAAVAARVAPIGGIAAESMRQATCRAEQHVARQLAKVRRSSRIGAARHMIAAEGLATVGEMIARYRGGGRFTSDYQIARLTVALRDLRVRDDAWARMDPAHAGAHLRMWIDVTRRAQPGHVAAPAALLALAGSRQPQVMARAVRHTVHPPGGTVAARKGADAAGCCRRQARARGQDGTGQEIGLTAGHARALRDTGGCGAAARRAGGGRRSARAGRRASVTGLNPGEVRVRSRSGPGRRASR